MSWLCLYYLCVIVYLLRANCLLLYWGYTYAYTYAYAYAMGGSDGTYPLFSNSTSVEENESFILFLFSLVIRLRSNRTGALFTVYTITLQIVLILSWHTNWCFYILYIYKSVVIHQHYCVDKYIILNVLQVEDIQENGRPLGY